MFNVGDPVRVKQGYPFAGHIGQICFHIDKSKGVYGIILDYIHNSDQCNVITNREVASNIIPFAEQELELIKMSL